MSTEKRDPVEFNVDRNGAPLCILSKPCSFGILKSPPSRWFGCFVLRVTPVIIVFVISFPSSFSK